MFDFSFSNIPKNYSDENQFPLLAALDFGKLKKREEIETKPIICENCGSILIDLARLTKLSDEYEFICAYCAAKNRISSDRYQQAKGYSSQSSLDDQKTNQIKDLAFLLQQITDQKEEALKKLDVQTGETRFPFQVAIIDISGSMAGAKLEAVKHALVQNINKLTAQTPHLQFVLILFDTNVQVFTDPEAVHVFRDGPLFFDLNKMQQVLTNNLHDKKILNLKSSHEKWTKLVNNLHSLSMTALGPALHLGVETLLHYNNTETGGKILLLTDGLANVGVGAVEQNFQPDGESAQFYHKIAERCVKNNIIVDMVGVRDQNGSNSVALDIIGQVTNYTGGNMLFITADQIESAFGTLRNAQYVARNVILRIFAPEFVKIAEIQGVHVFGDISTKIKGEPIQLGGFTPDREIYIKFLIRDKSSLKQDQYPIQIQLEYLDEQGNKKLRTLEQQIHVVSQQEEFLKKFNAKIATAYELSKASMYRAKGKVNEAKSLSKSIQARNLNLQQNYGTNLEELNALVADEEEEWAREDAEMEQAQVADKKSYYAAKGQSRYRASFQAKMKRMQKKKEEK